MREHPMHRENPHSALDTHHPPPPAGPGKNACGNTPYTVRTRTPPRLTNRANPPTLPAGLRGNTMPIRIHNLYCDAQGESHWRDIQIDWAEENDAGKL